MADDGKSDLKESSPLLSSANHLSNPLYEGIRQKVSPLSQGLYMKHLLKHLTIPNLTISEIFEGLYSSFRQGTRFANNPSMIIVICKYYMSYYEER